MFATPEVREIRLQKLGQVIEKLQLDALILTRLENVRYATDIRPLHSIFFVENYQAMVVPGKKPFLLASEADGKFITTRMPWVEWLSVPSFVPSGTLGGIQAELVADCLDRSVRRIGFDTLSVSLHEELKSRLDAEFVSANETILKARSIKDELEIEIMERATQFAEIGYEAVRRSLEPGVAEFELAAVAIYAIKKAGAEAESHMPAIRSGENAANMQRVESSRRVLPGDSVIVDLGARYLGYSAEYCRTMMAGRPGQKLKEMYAVLFEAYSRGIEKMKPGVLVGDVDKAIRDVIIGAGYPDYPHATGHGIGMANGEYPTINRGSQVLLEEGMTVCLEPGIYMPGIGGVKEEDIIMVTETGYRTLSHTPYDTQLKPL
jgi:Xaa-Pro aminopeptidase